MNKQEALGKLTDLVGNGFYFKVNEDADLTSKADSLLYRTRNVAWFEVDEAWDESENDWDKYGCGYYFGSSFQYLGVAASDFYSTSPHTYFTNCWDEYGKEATEVSFKEMEELLSIVESEEDTSQSQPTTSGTLSVKAANQTELGEVGVYLELGIVNHILTLEQAKELNALLVEVLDQFALELSIGDVVSDNEQALIVRGIIGDNIWCENEQSRQFFTKKRDKLFLTHKVVH